MPTRNGKGVGMVYVDNDKANTIVKVLKTTPVQDKKIKEYMASLVGNKARYHPYTNSCRHFSMDLYDNISNGVLSGQFGE